MLPRSHVTLLITLPFVLTLGACQDHPASPSTPEFDAVPTSFAPLHRAGNVYRIVPMGIAGRAHAINNRNEVVGWTRNGSGEARAFLWRNGSVEELPGLGGSSSGAYGISDGGLIVGEAENADGHLRAVLWRHGHPMDLGTLGGSTSQARAVNNRGQVVGSSEAADGRIVPFIWWNGTMRKLPIPPALAAHAAWSHGINDPGDVVGTAAGAGQWAILWSRERVHVLETPCHEAGASAINARRQIVGGGLGCPVSPFEIVPLLWHGDRPAQHLEPLGGLQEVDVETDFFQNIGNAVAINARGQITGWSDANPDVTVRDVRATLWYRDQAFDLNGDAAFVNPTDINDRGIVVGNSEQVPVLILPGTGPRIAADPDPDVRADLSTRHGEADLLGSRADEPWATRLCEAKGSLGGTSTVAEYLAGCP